MKKNIWKKFLPFIGLILFIYLLWRFDCQKIYQSILEVNVWYLLFLLPLLFLVFYVQTLKWNLILRNQGIKVNLITLYKIQLVGAYYASLTPAKVGNLVKIFYLKDRVSQSIEECSSSAIIDKILETITLIFLGAIGSFFLIDRFPNLYLQLIFILAIITLLFYIFYSKKRTRFVLKFLFNLIVLEKLKGRLRQSFHLFYDRFPCKRQLILPTILAIINWFLIYCLSFVVALALGIKINFFIFILLLPLAAMAGLLPITILGLGTRETALIILFQPYGLLPEKLIVMSVLSLVLNFILPALIGLILSFKLIKQKQEING